MTLRKALFWTHLAAGVTAGIVILILSVTGVLLAFERQVIAWVDRGARSAPPAGGPGRPSIDAILASIPARGDASPSAITLRSDPFSPAEVSFGRDQVLLADAYTGKPLGESAPRTRRFFRATEDLHRWLGAGVAHRAAGRAVTGACNLAFLVLLISGPILWLPRRWSWPALRSVLAFRRGLSGRARDFNWHNVLGIWCAAPLLVIVLSGVVMSYPWANNFVYRITGTEPPARGNTPRAEGEARAPGRARGHRPRAAFDPLWEKAEQQVPGWKSITMRISPSGRGPVNFTIDRGDGGRPDLRAQLAVNTQTGEVVRWEPFSSYNSGRRVRSWLRFLHTGEASGLIGQTIAAVVSAGAAVLVWTGLSLSLRRLFRWRTRAKQVAVTGGQEHAFTVR
jgi:uncharacterized iron-regulated membrane protein